MAKASRMDNSDGVTESLRCDQEYGQGKDNNHDVHDRQREKSFWALCKDKRYRGKLFLSSCLGCSLFCVWLVEAQPGPTFLDLQIITRTGLEEASRYYTIHTAGFMIGCALCAILSKKVRPNILISIGLFGIGASAIATPFCSSYSLMMTIRWLSGIFPGVTESTIYSEQMRIWKDEGKSVTQLIMLIASAGLFLAPVISEPFLAPKRNQTTEYVYKHVNPNTVSSLYDDQNDVNLTASGLTSKYINANLNFSREISHEDFKIGIELTHQKTDVFYAFLITGGLTIVISIFFFFCYRLGKAQIYQQSGSKVNEEISSRSIPKTLKVVLISSFCLYSLFINGVGLSFFSFLMPFLVNRYDHITKSQGAYILTLFICCGTGSRLLLIILSDRVRARYLLGFFVIFVFISFVSFTVAAEFDHTAAVIILTGIMNIAIAPALPLTLSWCQADYLRVTPFLSSSVTFTSALGFMLNPLLLSHLMEKYNDMWFCYLHTIEAFIPMAILFAMFVFNKYYVNRKYGPLLVSLKQEKNDAEVMMTDRTS